MGGFNTLLDNILDMLRLLISSPLNYVVLHLPRLNFKLFSV